MAANWVETGRVVKDKQGTEWVIHWLGSHDAVLRNLDSNSQLTLGRAMLENEYTPGRSTRLST